MKHILAGVAIAALLAGCASNGTTPVVQPVTQASIQADQAKVVYFLQAAGCLASDLSTVAAPIVQAVADQKGNAVLTAATASAAAACSVTVPAAAVTPAAAPSAPATPS